ncbi:hypothetical protein GCM10011391_13640 [Pullulanibacillus camelliae]|uniref:NERD domain-containing protein n=1 Tax=Pullulanibacillus camelliae TaxID=1707096 RepID=A0A8J2VLB9_9BACL|nr:NERD domain-containing protein [Pullulanibacillus camelliae]GGE36104.1 hypothetical protein GCM10011391_13640 [Pullulanibacillus camelliae]
MIKKQRFKSQKVQALDALLRCLPENHRKRFLIQSDYSKYWKGLQGERSIDYELADLPTDGYDIYRDVRLVSDSYTFQIDLLILTPYFLLIIESKNLNGIVHIDKTNQFFQIIEGKETKISSPLHQVHRQVFRLQKWILSHGIPHIPIKWFIAFTNPTMTIRNESNDYEIVHNILHAESLTDTIRSLASTFQKKSLSKNELNKMHQFILSEHKPPTTDILNDYNISIQDFEKGVRCPKCKKSLMRISRLIWYCDHCGHKSKNAHVQKINDYFSIVNSQISIQDGGEWLNISSRHVIRKLFYSMKLVAKGNTRNRVYVPPASMNVK